MKNSTRSLAEIKSDLVNAHRLKDWDLAKNLSQEKNLVKRRQRRSCVVCGATLTRGTTRCRMHYILNRYYKRALAAATALFMAVCAYASPPTNPPPALVCGWTHSPSTNVVAYKVYWGPSTRNYTNFIQVGYVTSASITNVTRNTWYWVSATALDDNGLESDFSNEVSVRVPNKPNPPTAFNATPQ